MMDIPQTKTYRIVVKALGHFEIEAQDVQHAEHILREMSANEVKDALKTWHVLSWDEFPPQEV